MKKILLIILLAPFLLISQSKQAIDTVTTDQLEFKENLRYKIETSEPFTGVWRGIDRNIRFEYHYVNGLQDGLSTVWHRNGQKEYEEYYKKGERDGLKINWNSKGEKSSEIYYNNDETPRKKTNRYFHNNSIVSGIEEYILKSNTWKLTRSRKTSYYKNGGIRLEVIYNSEDKTESETIWYADGSKKEEKNNVNNKRSHKIWDHNGYELLPEALIPKDTIDVEEIEWKQYTANKKGNNKLFTGIVTLPGVLNYPRNNKRNWHVPNNQYFSTATIVLGKLNGPYTKWYKKNGQKMSEITMTGDWYKIIPNGPYTIWYEDGQMARKGDFRDGKKDRVNTTWYENGQMSSQGYFSYGKVYGKMTLWYKNGQIKREGRSQNGKRIGKFIVWDENGKKSFEPTYYNGKIIKSIERDENGNIVKEWPEVDEDKYGLRLFLNEFISILKTKKYDDIKNLMASKEDFINYVVWANLEGKELSNEMLEEVNEVWSENLSKTIDDIKKEVDIEYIFKDRTILILYDYLLVNEDKTTEEIKWPKSINYELPKAKYIAAHITILLGDYPPLIIKKTLFYLNNKWCFLIKL